MSAQPIRSRKRRSSQVDLELGELSFLKRIRRMGTERACDNLVTGVQLAEPRSPADRVYFIQCGDGYGPVKIGFTRDIARRVSELQLANPYPLRVILELVTSEDFEQALHRRFSGAHIRGEWFDFTPELSAWVESARASLQKSEVAA